MAEKDPKYIMERYGWQREHMRTNWHHEKLQMIAQECGLRCLRHVQRISDKRIAKQVSATLVRLKQAWPCINYHDMVNNNFKKERLT